MAKKKGIFYNMIIGGEKPEDYARRTLPSSRWALGKEILFHRFGFMFKTNLLMVISLLPIIALIFLQTTLSGSYQSLLPQNSIIGAGYPAIFDVSLQSFVASQQYKQLFFVLLMPIAILISCIPLSGLFYVMRNAVWAEGIFVAHDFWKGIKTNIGRFLFIGLIYAVVIALLEFGILTCERIIYLEGAQALPIISQIVSYIVMVFATIMTLYMMTMQVTYKLTLKQMFTNSFKLTIGLFPQNVFFLLFAALPALICLLIGLIFSGFTTLVLILYILFGFSFALMVWTNFSHYVYDRFLNDKVEGAEKNKGIYPKFEKGENPYKSGKILLSKDKKVVKPISDEEVTITELPQTFSRKDLERLKQEKEAMKQDSERWAKEHENDEQEIVAGRKVVDDKQDDNKVEDNKKDEE